MSTTKPLSASIHEWTEISTHQGMRSFKQFIARTDLSPTQVSALYRLHFGKSCGVTEIAGNLDVTNAAASQMVDRLVQRGYIERTEDPVDRRAKQLTLTEKGRKLVQESFEARREWMEMLVVEIEPEKQAVIASALDMLIDAGRRLDEKYGISTREPRLGSCPHRSDK